MIHEASKSESETPSPSPSQPEVFVSYARVDEERVVEIVRLLEERGVTVWRDGEQVLGGQYYGGEIADAIAHSLVVLVTCSPHSFQSVNVQRDVLLNWDDYHRQCIPVWLSVPGETEREIPERFRDSLMGCQWVDAHSDPPDRWLPQSFEALERLGVGTKYRGGQPGQATPTPTSAPTPQPPSAPDASDPARRGPRFRPGDRPVRGADWELEKLLGKGGFGEVWKARHPELPDMQPVALKFCLQLDEKSKDLLRHEANIVLRAQQRFQVSPDAHTNGIVPLVHAYLNNDPPCLEYPYVEAGTLVRLIDEARKSGAGSLRPDQAQQIVLRLAQIVSAAHAATPKLIHRDLKPSNILVERRADGKIVLFVTDFGIGGLASQQVLERTLSASLQQNMSSVLTGSHTPLYASPQQMRGDKPDPRDDVYALGVIWYQLLTGDLTTSAPTGRRWAESLRRNGVSHQTLDLLSSCFESDPADRPADAGVLARSLEALPRSASAKSAGAATRLPVADPAQGTSLHRTAPRGERHADFGELSRAQREGHSRAATIEPGRAPPRRGSPAESGDQPGGPARGAPSPPDTEPKPLPPTPPLEPERSEASAVAPQPHPASTATIASRLGGRRLKLAAVIPALAGLSGVLLYVASKLAPPEPADSSPPPTVASPPASVTPQRRSATAQPEYLTTGVGQIKLRLIPAGQFMMGSDESDPGSHSDEVVVRDGKRRKHLVRITQPFYLGVTEVTRGQFRIFADDTGYKTETEKDGKGAFGWNEETKRFEQNPKFTWQNAGYQQSDEHPVVNVSWNDAQAFITWLSEKEGKAFRLPTEAEWEYACRAGTTTRFSSGDDLESLASVANVADATAKEKFPRWTTIAARDGFVYTAPVGQFRPNAFDLYDMHGNVWEWCSDWYDANYYKQSPTDDPRGPDAAAIRVIRGGGWGGRLEYCKSAYRLRLAPGDRCNAAGFRLALSLSGR
jgi:formylglycine-generating enzyme required for sulfatase activity/serine/threonine protein kinase